MRAVTVLVLACLTATVIAVIPSTTYDFAGAQASPNTISGRSRAPLKRLTAPTWPNGDPAGTQIDWTGSRPTCCEFENAIYTERDRTNFSGLTGLSVSFGQFSLSHDVAISGENSTDIFIESGCTDSDPVELHRSNRANTAVRSQENEITAFLDLSAVYGENLTKGNGLRAFDNTRRGRLATAPDNDLLPPRYCPDTFDMANPLGIPRGQFFCMGDVRGNENPRLLAIHVLWVRNHNTLADRIAEDHPDWSDDEVFYYARAWNIAVYQHILTNEYLPIMMGPALWTDLMADSYTGWNPSREPGAFVEFTHAGWRTPHSLLTETLLHIDADGVRRDFFVKDVFFQPGLIASLNMDGWIKGMTEGPASEFAFNFPPSLLRNPGVMDLHLGMRDCFRGRDGGIGSYNDVREALFLPRLASYDEITTNAETLEKLWALYPGGDPDDLDFFVGTLAEDPVEGGILGRTAIELLALQFNDIRSGDAFWFQNPDNHHLAPEDMEKVLATNYARVILDNSPTITCVHNSPFKMPFYAEGEENMLCRESPGSMSPAMAAVIGAAASAIVVAAGAVGLILCLSRPSVAARRSAPPKEGYEMTTTLGTSDSEAPAGATANRPPRHAPAPLIGATLRTPTAPPLPETSAARSSPSAARSSPAGKRRPPSLA